jgi:hypothetical protein
VSVLVGPLIHFFREIKFVFKIIFIHKFSKRIYCFQNTRTVSPSKMSTTIEQSLKQIIAAAIHQVKSKAYERAEDVDPVEAFIEDLFAVLFPTQQPQQQTEVQHVTVPTVAAAPEKPKRGRKPKAAEPEIKQEQPQPEAAPEKPKRGRKPKAPTTPPAAPEQTEAPPAPKKEQAKNIDKLTATNKKHIKKWAEEVGVAEPDTKALLAHVNAMSAEEFNALTFEQHVKSFLKPAEQPQEEAEMELLEMEFQGKTYYVKEDTERVYEMRDDVPVAVGYVGMAAFADMKL